MSRIPPECARLAAELRLLRERSALTLAALAEESSYSKSSWHRYLKGTALPPFHAVRTLCRLADDSEPRLRALWELAETAWSGRDSVAPAAVPAAAAQAPEPAAVAPHSVVPGANAPRNGHRPRWSPRGVRVTASAAVLAAALAVAITVVVVVVRPRLDAAALSARLPSTASGIRVLCTGADCDGRDPGTERCGVQPQTLLHLQTPSRAGLEIRYNPLCRAVWARVWNTRLADRLTLEVPGRPAQSIAVDTPGAEDTFVYTAMDGLPQDSRSLLTACLTTGPRRTAECYSAPSP